MLFVCHVKSYFRVDWLSDLDTIENVALCFLGRYFILNAEMGEFFFFLFFFCTPSFRCTSLVRLCPSLAHRLEPSGQQGATMCCDGEHLSCRDVDGGGAHCSPGAFVSDTVPLWGLMRTNWSECNKWIMELDKRLYFAGCVCWDPPIICPLSRARWLASAWSGSLNISLSLSCLFYYMSTLFVQLPTSESNSNVKFMSQLCSLESQ